MPSPFVALYCPWLYCTRFLIFLVLRCALLTRKIKKLVQFPTADNKVCYKTRRAYIVIRALRVPDPDPEFSGVLAASTPEIRVFRNFGVPGFSGVSI